MLQRLNNPFMRSFALLLSGTAAGQLIVVLFAPIATRLYSPDDFGYFAVFLALFSLFSAVSSLRYELAIPLPTKDSDARNILLLALLINFVFSLFLLFFILFCHKTLISWFQLQAAPFILYFLPLAVAVLGWYKCFNFWCVRKKAYAPISQTKLMQGFSNVLIQLVAGVCQAKAYGLVFAQMAGQTTGVFSLQRQFRLPLTVLFRQMKKKALITQAKRQYRFPLYDTPAALVNVASEQLPQFLLAVLFHPAIAGFYILAHRILIVPSSLIGQSMGQVIYGVCKEKMDLGELSSFARKIAFRLWCLALLPAVFLFFFSEDLFPMIFGSTWQMSGRFAGWMVLGVAVQFAYSPLSMILTASDGQKTNFLLHTGIFILRLIAILYGWVNHDPLLSIVGYSIIGFCGYAFGVFLVIKRAKFRGKEQLCLN